MIKEYYNYNKNHSSYNENNINKRKYFDKEKIYVDKNTKVLEIGFGKAQFTEKCSRKKVKEYTGIEATYSFYKNAKKKYPAYNFVYGGAIETLEKNTKKYDLIYMNQVFEHISMNEGKKLIEKLYSKLEKNGKIINIFPNAASTFSATYLRYNDITHKTLYTENSIRQIINSLEIKKAEIYNEKIGKTSLKRIIHLIYRFFIEIIYKTQGYNFPRTYTKNMVVIIKK